MIIRQTVNFATHLLAGVLMGALVVGSICRWRQDREEKLEPKYPPPPPSAPVDV